MNVVVVSYGDYMNRPSLLAKMINPDWPSKCTMNHNKVLKGHVNQPAIFTSSVFTDPSNPQQNRSSQVFIGENKNITPRSCSNKIVPLRSAIVQIYPQGGDEYWK